MRPLNAPHNRLLVLAALVPRLLDPLFIPRLWKACREFSLDPSRGARAFEKAFEIREGHFLPDYGCPGIGRERIHEIVVNVVAPILHIAGTGEEPEICTEQAVRLFFSFPSAARNRAVLQGARRLSLPFHISSGAQQGLLELQVEYCEKSRCGECLLSRGI
jgi:hypothetical protein